MSDDGTKLAAGMYNGHIYTSSNSGAAWTNRSTATGSAIAGNRNWQSTAISDDGQELAAAAWNGHIYTSFDSGAAWVDRSR